MIASRIEAPQGVFNPEHRINQWKVLRRGIRGKPNTPQPIRGGKQFVFYDINIVIPDKPAMPDRLVGQNRGPNQQQPQEPRPAPKGPMLGRPHQRLADKVLGWPGSRQHGRHRGPGRGYGWRADRKAGYGLLCRLPPRTRAVLSSIGRSARPGPATSSPFHQATMLSRVAYQFNT